MHGDAIDPVDGPRVTPDRPKASGDKAPRIALAVALSIVVVVVLIIASIVILLLL